MSIQRFFLNLEKEHYINISFACELKGSGYGFGKNERSEVFYLYNSPAWNYYRITDRPVILDPVVENGIKYVGMDIVEAAKRVYNNAFSLYRNLKSSQIYVNKYSTRDDFIQIYLDGDFCLVVADNAEKECKNVLNFDMARDFTLYEYLEATHFRLMVRTLRDIRIFPYSHLEHIFERYMKSVPSLEFYADRLEYLIARSKVTPHETMEVEASDLDFSEMISVPMITSRKQPKNDLQKRSINEVISQILNF